MKHEMGFKMKNFDHFCILKDQGYPGTECFFNFSRNNWLNIIDGVCGRIRKTGNYDDLEVIKDPDKIYMYYMMKYHKDVLKWYKSTKFTFYSGKGKKSSQLIFVKNNYSDTLHNVLYKRMWTDISIRMSINSRVYVATNHSISRARLRIPEVSDKSNFGINSWLIKKVNRECKPAHIKKDFVALSLLSHDFEKADYFMDENRNVYVVINHILATVHGNESERFKLN